MRPNKQDIGAITSVYFGYSSDPKVRSGAASGGVVTQILLDLLRDGVIDYAVVSRMQQESGRIQAKLISTKNSEDVLSARTSIYFDFDLLKQLLALIDPTKKYGIVMLPCQAKAFNAFCESKGWTRDNFIIIGLFCGHATDRELLDLYFAKKKIEQKDVVDFRFRVGHWRGKSIISMSDGRQYVYPTLKYNIYQNLYFFTKTRCLSCEDHFAAYADVSCGDAWLRALKSELIKHSLIITRNEATDRFLADHCSKTLVLRRTDYMSLLSSQKRSVIFHNYNIHGRSVLAPLFGIKVVSSRSQKPRWNDLVGAFFILLNYRLSEMPIGRKILMRIPYAILYSYAMFIKLFINF